MADWKDAGKEVFFPVQGKPLKTEKYENRKRNGLQTVWFENRGERLIENVSHKKEATQLKTLKVIAEFFSYSLVTLGLLLQVFMDRAVKIDHMLVMETVKNLPTYFPITDESCSAQST